MAYLRRQLLLGLIAILIMPVVAQGQASVGCAEFDATDSETMFTSAPAGEPSLFQSQLQQKNEDLEKRVQRLEEELYSRNRQPSAGVLTRLEQSLQSQEVGTGGLFADVEVTFLRPHLSGAVGAFGHGPTVHRIITSDYTTGVRYGLGYMTDSGVGIRGRYWSMDDDYQYVDPFSANRLGLRLDVADLEMVLNQRLRHWDMQISGGVRYAKLKYDNANATLFGPGTLTFEGFGPTGRFDARRWLGNSGVSVFGNLRGAVLIGDHSKRGVIYLYAGDNNRRRSDDDSRKSTGRCVDPTAQLEFPA